MAVYLCNSFLVVVSDHFLDRLAGQPRFFTKTQKRGMQTIRTCQKQNSGGETPLKKAKKHTKNKLRQAANVQ
jgi:hypothetical protein